MGKGNPFPVTFSTGYIARMVIKSILSMKLDETLFVGRFSPNAGGNKITSYYFDGGEFLWFSVLFRNKQFFFRFLVERHFFFVNGGEIGRKPFFINVQMVDHFFAFFVFIYLFKTEQRFWQSPLC